MGFTPLFTPFRTPPISAPAQFLLPYAAMDPQPNAPMHGRIIDFHTHAFPDALATRAIAQLEHGGGVKAFHDGRIASLLSSMDQAGIATSVVCSIATKPEQFRPILEWSRAIASPRIVPLPSIHPAAADPIGQAEEVAAAGFAGIKIHPYYQAFDLDEARVLPLYRACERLGLIVVAHTGFDFAFPRDRKGDPTKILNVLSQVPDLRFVATHLGAWDDWDEVEAKLIGQPISLDLSLSLELLGAERAAAMLSAHPQDRILFGTDSPWASQAETLVQVRALNLSPEREQGLLRDNAADLLKRA